MIVVHCMCKRFVQGIVCDMVKDLELKICYVCFVVYVVLCVCGKWFRDWKNCGVVRVWSIDAQCSIVDEKSIPPLAHRSSSACKFCLCL